MESLLGEYEDVYNYISRREYPAGLSKNDKRRILERSSSFAVKVGQLMHRGTEDKLCRVIVDPTEKTKIIINRSAFRSGRRKSFPTSCDPMEMITERFWWRNVASNVRDFVRSCPACQKANPTNKAPPSELSPTHVNNGAFTSEFYSTLLRNIT